MANNTFDFRLQVGPPQFRVPSRLVWTYYVYWILFVTLLGFCFYNKVKSIGAQTRISLLVGSRETMQAQSSDLDTKIKALRQSNESKDLWMPFVASRSQPARFLARTVEALPPNVRLDGLRLTQGNDPSKVEAQLQVVVNNLPTEAAQQKVVEFRSAFRTFLNYSLESNTDNDTGSARSIRLRGVPMNEYRVRETWTFKLTRATDDEVYRSYQKLNSNPLFK